MPASLLDEPSGSRWRGARFDFIAADDDARRPAWAFLARGAGCCFPGLASDFACMIRAALALYEATGERVYLEQRWPGSARSTAHYADPDTGGYFLTADDAEPGCCGRMRPATTPRPILTRWRRRTWSGSRLLPATTLGASRPTADRGLSARPGENLFGHVSLLNALDLRLRAAEIVVPVRARARKRSRAPR